MFVVWLYLTKCDSMRIWDPEIKHSYDKSYQLSSINNIDMIRTISNECNINYESLMNFFKLSQYSPLSSRLFATFAMEQEEGNYHRYATLRYVVMRVSNGKLINVKDIKNSVKFAVWALTFAPKIEFDFRLDHRLWRLAKSHELAQIYEVLDSQLRSHRL